ncbi:hypothetical protein N2152v2_001404 [Parachlorella kessleri]
MVKVPSVNGPPTASSSRDDVREAVAFLESEDEGALSGFKFSWRRLFLHMGPGFLMCVAFVDPGNLESDLQAGARTGYSLLWMLMWSTIMGYLLQALAAKLGVATGKHLAEQCRQHYSPLVRSVLWAMAELAIIGSDIQEVIGTAIALRLLSGGRLPLYAGVLVAAVTAYVLLFLERLGITLLEHFFQVLIGVMSISFGYMFFSVDIPYKDVTRGMLVPSLSRDSISVACGILGAVIMPHNLFLHSALVHSRQVHSARPARREESVLYYSIEAAVALVVTLFINTCVISVFARGFYDRSTSEDIGLENAGQYLGSVFGKQMQVVWAVGLLAAGQSSTMTGTYAGQFVMTGFLELKVSAFLRTLISRAVALCPTLLVALRYRHDSTKMDDLNQWLNILQSIQLPFAVIPLLVLTSDPRVMGWRFSNSRATSSVCWAIAAGIIAINFSVAYQAAVTHLPPSLAAHCGFWSLVMVYFLFLLYLILSPARVACWYQRLRGRKAAAERDAGESFLDSPDGFYAGPPGRGTWRAQQGAAAAALAAGAGNGAAAAEGEGIIDEAPPTPFTREDEQLLSPHAVVYRVRGNGSLQRVQGPQQPDVGPFAAGRPSLDPRPGGRAGGGGRRCGRGTGGLEEPLLQDDDA